jgi:hypothetical protein
MVDFTRNDLLVLKDAARAYMDTLQPGQCVEGWGTLLVERDVLALAYFMASRDLLIRKGAPTTTPCEVKLQSGEH